MAPLDHDFERSSEPDFGSFFGGACAHESDDITCGWPESAHQVAAPRDAVDDAEFAEFNAVLRSAREEKPQ